MLKVQIFWGVVIDSNRSWEIRIERTCSRISRNLFIINRLSKVLDLNERKAYCGLMYPLLSYGIVVWGHSAKANTTRIFALQKRAVRYTAAVPKRLESCRNSFRNLKILTVYSLYIQETILYVKKECKCTVNKQIHTHNTRKNKDYHKYLHNLELYSSKPPVAGCIFYKKLPNNIKQIENNNEFARELKKLLIKGCYYSIQDYLNEEFSTIGY
jgi:hypothetical protein